MSDRLMEQLKNFVLFEKSMNPGTQHIATWTLEEINRLRAALAALAARDERVRELEALRDLVLTETGEDSEGNMPHEPREALLILRNAARALLAPPATPALDDGWIAWEGGAERPVPSTTKLEVRFRNGTTSNPGAQPWVWTHGGGEADIIAYRIAPPAKEPR